MRKGLKKLLINYLNANDGFHTKGYLGHLAEQWGYSSDSASRCLRQLTEDKEIANEYYNGKYAKNLVKYARLGEKKVRNLPTIMIIDGIPKAVYN